MAPAANPWQSTLLQGERAIAVETGRIGAQADGSVWLRCGREALLVTATSEPGEKPAQGFFPLTVEYREKLGGAGRIPGSFFRREGRAGQRETLGSRLIDRAIRPHFPDGFVSETQVIATLHGFDEEGDPRVLALTGASIALHCSDIPWAGPIAGVRVIEAGGNVVVFPSASERRGARLDLVVAVNREGLVMVEGRADEVPEMTVIAALAAAREAAAPLLAFQEEMRAAAGREKRAVVPPARPVEIEARLAPLLLGGMEEVYAARDKRTRRERLAELIRSACAQVSSAGTPDSPEGASEEPEKVVQAAAERVVHDEIRRRALAGRRLDGRKPEEVRPISGETGILPGAHGSALFTRGETQALVTCTLGTRQDEQLIEEPAGVHHERFLLHYTFPPYSVGEVRPLRGPGRREIGHGHLARRALLAVLPGADEFPYTVRLDAEITSSNGSSSMATVCGATLALMDAGAPIRRPVAGIAMGLIEERGERVILSDILGDEDHLGDMDFKVAGTSAGVTALQLDNKVGSLPAEVLARALEQARAGRLHILAEMARVRASAREAVPPHAPQVLLTKIRPARIRDLIGPGGRHIQGIQQATGAQIDIGDDGRVLVSGKSPAALKEAARQVRHYTGEPVSGRFYRGRVSGIAAFGVFVELFHGIEGLVPRSEMESEAEGERPLAVGDELVVKVAGTTREGKIQLSCAGTREIAATDLEE